MANMTPAALIGEHFQILLSNAYVNSTGKLVANTAVSITVPDNARYVAFTRDNVASKFFAKQNATASVPSTLTNDGTAAVANPTEWRLTGLNASGNYISIVSEDADLIVTCIFSTGLRTGTGSDKVIG